MRLWYNGLVRMIRILTHNYIHVPGIWHTWHMKSKTLISYTSSVKISLHGNLTLDISVGNQEATNILNSLFRNVFRFQTYAYLSRACVGFTLQLRLIGFNIFLCNNAGFNAIYPSPILKFFVYDRSIFLRKYFLSDYSLLTFQADLL